MPQQLVINGSPQEIDETMTLDTVLGQLGYELPSIVVALDGTFVPRSRYAETTLYNHRELEVLSPMQGG